MPGKLWIIAGNKFKMCYNSFWTIDKLKPSLNKIGQFSIRTIDEDKNNAFGSSIMVDGIPVSNNANMNLIGKGGSYSVAEKVDLRSLGTTPGSIEVIRGVASAEYGDVIQAPLL